MRLDLLRIGGEVPQELEVLLRVIRSINIPKRPPSGTIKEVDCQESSLLVPVLHPCRRRAHVGRNLLFDSDSYSRALLMMQTNFATAFLFPNRALAKQELVT